MDSESRERKRDREREEGGITFYYKKYIEVRDMDCAPLSKSKVSFEPFSRVSCFLDGINGRLANLKLRGPVDGASNLGTR